MRFFFLLVNIWTQKELSQQLLSRICEADPRRCSSPLLATTPYLGVVPLIKGATPDIQNYRKKIIC